MLDNDDLLLCDIRDVEALEAAFDRSRPEIVFHAAALKHLTLLERNPSEAFKTNVLGTRNVLEAARRVGVETFVNISTDKAAHPTCVLGWSQARRGAAHRQLRRAAATGRYVSVRFGNVLGSRGSVVPGVHGADRAEAGPSRSPTPTSSATSCSSPRPASWCSRPPPSARDGEVMVLDMG